MNLAKKIVNEFRVYNSGEFDYKKFETYFGEIIHNNPAVIIKNKLHFNKLIDEINKEIKKVKPKEDDSYNSFGIFEYKISVSMYINCADITRYDTIQHVFIKKYVEEYYGMKTVDVLEDYRYLMNKSSVDMLGADITKRNEMAVFGTEEEMIYHKNENKKMVRELPDGYRADIYILHLEDYILDIRKNKRNFSHYIIEASKYLKMDGILIVVIDGNDDYPVDKKWEKVGIYPLLAFTQSKMFFDSQIIDEDQKEHSMLFAYSDLIVFKKGFVQRCCFTKLKKDITKNEASIAIRKAVKGDDSVNNIFYRNNNELKTLSYKTNLSLFYKEVAERKRLKEGYSRWKWDDLICLRKPTRDDPKNVVVSLTPNLTYDSRVFFKSKAEYRNNILLKNDRLYLKDFPRNVKWVEYILNNIDDKTKEEICKINLLKRTYENEEDYSSYLYYADEDTELGVLLNRLFYVDSENNILREKSSEKGGGDVVQDFGRNHEYNFEKGFFQYRLSDSVLREFINSTCFEKLLNDRHVRKDYFFIWLECNDGRAFEDECKKLIIENNNMIRGGNYKPLADLHLTVPDVDVQKMLVFDLEKLDRLKEKIKRETNRIYESINVLPSQDNETFYLLGRDLLKLNDENQEFYNCLPQPLSSIIYNNYCELEISRKTRNYLYFFEASAAFLAVFLLSLSYNIDSKKMDDMIRNAFVYGNEKRKIFNCKMNFGTWTYIIKNVIMIYENNKKTEQNGKMSIGFSVEQINEAYSYIYEANQIRNSCYHGGFKTYDDEKKDLMMYETITDKIIGLFNRIFRQYEFVYGIKIISAPDGIYGDVKYYGRSMQGYSPRLKIKEYLNIKQVIDPDLNKIYIRDRLSNHFYDMLPLLRYQNLVEQDSSLKTSYFIDAFEVLLDENEIGDFTWKSFDAIKSNSIEFFDDELYKLLKKMMFNL